MKPPLPSGQLNLPMLTVTPSQVPHDKQTELVLALVDLLVQAAHHALTDRTDGGDHEREADR
jgi:hypothetical protein